MFIVENYTMAVLFCIVTMFCWGSWANTQKLASRTWSFQLYYWDYALGVVLFALIMGLTLGSNGDVGRNFTQDLMQASFGSLGAAFIGGVIFNLANLWDEAPTSSDLIK